MGTLTYAYKQSILNEIILNIVSGVSTYYAVGANPVPYNSNVSSISSSVYELEFINNWQTIFGKKLNSSNFCPVVNNNSWVSNTVYQRYDNTQENLNNFYIITPPTVVGADYIVYKCIDNANNSPSTIMPNLLQANTFYTSDGYAWRYMYNISNQNYVNFATSLYTPVIPNNSIISFSSQNSGVDVVVVANTGGGYNAYHDGIVQSVLTIPNQCVQISSNASFKNFYYNNNAIYIYSVGNNSPTSSQLFNITNYISNSSGNFVFTNGVVNTNSITVGQTNYKISPRVNFNTDGDTDPLAYSVINTASNGIYSIVVIYPGTNITWANVSITSNSNYGSGANLYAITPPPGGHGGNPSLELGIQGCSISFNFSNSETNTIPTNISYNTVGIIKNPVVLNSNGSANLQLYTGTTFNNLLIANTNSSTVFPIGTVVLGSNSGSLGTVAFSNSTVVYLTGDKSFVSGETIVSTNNQSLFTNISILDNGTVYTKNISPLYVQNINNVQRSNTKNEAYKLILQI